jgi:exodeoxyribonuclease V beta subunit
MTLRYRKPAILSRLPRNQHAVLEASAGTGKTYTLEHLVIDLVLTRGARLENILVVTFTEKATAELTSRVRSKIEELLGSPTPAPAEVPDEECWVLDEAARGALREALFGFDRANISTIHAFCQRVLTEHAFAHRRLFEERQIDERAAFGRAFKDVLRQKLAYDPVLSPYLAAWLARQGEVDDLEQFLFDCHRKQSRLTPAFDAPLLESVLDRLADDAPAYLQPVIDTWRERRDLPHILGMLDSLEKERRALPPALDRARAPLQAAVAHVCLPFVAERLRGQKREAGRFDFQDMLTLVGQSLDGPDGDALVRQLRERYHVALIDEFQDTDPVQWRIFERIFFEAPEGSRPLVLIGDPKQAIYGFRGADVHTYLRARQRIADGGGVVEPLTDNFRSTERVITAYNAILDQSASPPFFTGAIRYPHPVRCGDPDRAALDREGRPIAPVVLLEVQPVRGKKPRLVDVKRAIARRIAQETGRILASGMQVRKGDRLEPVRAKDIFVLTRSLTEGQEVGLALREAGIAHAYYKQDGLFQTAEAEHIRDLLAAVDDPHRLPRRLRAWMTPFFGLSLEELRRCQELPGTHPALARLLDWKALADDEDYEELFNRLLDESGLLRRLLFRDRGERELTNYLHLFEILLEQASRTRASLTELVTQLSGLIDKQANPEGVDGNVQRLESERDAVQIMTLHKSKGLEAAVVFLYGGFYPIGANDVLRSYHAGSERLTHVGRVRDAEVQARITQEAREEDQRLLYVGLTRARARLVLPCFPDGSYNLTEGACYKPLNQQLERLRKSADPAVRALFTVEQITLEGDSTPATPSGAGDGLAWQPPAELVDELVPDEAFRRAHKTHGGFTITSYTRMKQAQARAAAVEADEFTAERTQAAVVELPDDELPGGPDVGIFLHELLEEIELDSFRRARSLEAWRTRDEVRTLFDSAMRSHDRDPRHRAHAERLVYTAWTAPVRLGVSRLERGLASSARVAREMEFIYPYPEASHPRLDQALRGLQPIEIHRGFVKGFVDLVFEHEGRVYLADWKSDLLDAWDPRALARHVADHYGVQAALYSLALVKMLEVRDRAAYDERFGGMLFCFLRGMRPSLDGSAGLHFDKPSWDEVCAWDERLRRGEPLAGEAGGDR